MNSTVVVVNVNGVARVTDGTIDVNVLNNMTIDYIHGLFMNDITLFQRTTKAACDYIHAIMDAYEEVDVDSINDMGDACGGYTCDDCARLGINCFIDEDDDDEDDDDNVPDNYDWNDDHVIREFQ